MTRNSRVADYDPVYRQYVLPRWMTQPTTALPALPPRRPRNAAKDLPTG
ncbi:hypothetical protein F4553_006246 [Allocatelliglobosispora scoriae]|uniref:Uncharacterized protein n=1 Tax=Allocatelliglobosispora scoriae TaxID=643052 RepID=A0A841C177_9ACTN|nr:hypothetical protein [Allocatelliglobosispora scoriae]MBB5872812.1 hypothetical protein [Allocatelliglobosispora scoriae]